jgi:hypothetical protein
MTVSQKENSNCTIGYLAFSGCLSEIKFGSWNCFTGSDSQVEIKFHLSVYLIGNYTLAESEATE